MRNKLSKYFILSFLNLILTPLTYAQTPHTQVTIPAQAIESRHYRTLPFNKISVDGPISIRILSNQPKSIIQIRTDSRTLDNMHPFVNEDGVLEISEPILREKYSVNPIYVNISVPRLTSLEKTGSGNATVTNLNGQLSLIIDGPGNVTLDGHDIDLRYLQVAGPAVVNICGVNSCLLNVRQEDSSVVNLRGAAILQSLDFNGSGSFSLYWVNSNYIRIIAGGCGKISLAGVGCRLDATLYDRVCLAAKSLRVQQAFVNTDDYAQANVWVKDSLSTVARGCSNIYFYKKPAFLGKYNNPPATILDMSCIRRQDLIFQ